MKGIILAGGTGSRLYPLTKVTNKHLLPVGKEPMIFHPIKKLVEAEITEILIVTSTDHMGDVVSLLGSGKDFGCNFTYKVQDEAGGIAQALLLAENFVGRDSMCVLLGDNIFQDKLGPLVEAYERYKDGQAMVVLKEVDDPNRYGVVQWKGVNIGKIIEKPSTWISEAAVTGIYFYPSTVFNVIRDLKPSKRNELEITDVNNVYVAQKYMKYEHIYGYWTDAGTFESLELANKLMAIN